MSTNQDANLYKSSAPVAVGWYDTAVRWQSVGTKRFRWYDGVDWSYPVAKDATPEEIDIAVSKRAAWNSELIMWRVIDVEDLTP